MKPCVLPSVALSSLIPGVPLPSFRSGQQAKPLQQAREVLP